MDAVRALQDQPEHDALWAEFTSRFAFAPSTRRFLGITEPAASATWYIGAIADNRTGDALEATVQRGLLACHRDGEPLFWLDGQHPGYWFDPQRVGGHGQPSWPGSVYPVPVGGDTVRLRRRPARRG
jgi:hypothetical protein